MNMTKSYYDEKKEFIKTLLENTFFRDWKDAAREDAIFTNIELMLTPKCNLSCSYCYYNNKTAHGDGLYPPGIDTWEAALSNTDALFSYLEKNSYFPKSVDIFAGDALIHINSQKVIKKAVDFYHRNSRIGMVVIPTNMAFIRNDRIVKDLEELFEYGKERGVKILLSASIDGKYLDPINRKNANPCVNNAEYYSDEFYDKVFAFSKKHGIGFHPMVHHQGIELWKQNWDWFQEQFEKHGIAWYNIYLLEVRNDGWTKNSIQEYVKFYKYVLEYAYKKLFNHSDMFIKGFVCNGSGVYPNLPKMNMFNNVGTMGRGIGCSLQTTMQIRMGDLSVVPCHRQSYDWCVGFKFVTQGGEIVDIEPKNAEFYSTQLTMDTKAFPYCETCLIRNLCCQGCPGSQLEVNGDAFMPIQSVCLLEHGKVKAQIEFLRDNGLYSLLISLLNKEQRMTFELVNKYLIGEE